MPKAEVGSTKYIANKLKAKGLQRLRWYCQLCEKQCRDENGFKQHTMSEGHVRNMLMVGEDPKKYIEDYSRQFLNAFMQMLKTSHGEQKVHMNHFYQDYIRDKEHIHMNATKWSSLTEFAKYLGRQGLCRVEEGDRGLEIAWIDDRPDTIRRREEVKRKERQAKGDEDLEAKLLEQQIARAREQAALASKSGAAEHKAHAELADDKPQEPVKVSLSLGAKVVAKPLREAKAEASESAPVAITEFSTASEQPAAPEVGSAVQEDESMDRTDLEKEVAIAPITAPKMSLSSLNKPKAVNPLMAKKNPLSKKREALAPAPEKKMSNAERIMREEMEAKKIAEERMSTRPAKKQRTEWS